MSLATISSFAFSGIEAVPVEVQCQIASGLPAFLVVAKDQNDSEKLLGQLVEMGCGYEGANRSYVAINIPPHVRLEEVQDLLEKLKAQWECADPTFE
jgi:hypothetical protein